MFHTLTALNSVPAVGTPIPVWFEVASLVIVLAILAGDLALAYRRPHIPSSRESAIWVAVYVSLALLFAAAMFVFASADHAGEFIAGWATEYSLSIDNLFVFVLIMTKFSVPRKYQQEVLMVGIIVALVLRGIFILLGAALIENFSWIFYIFGAFLLYTAVQQALESPSEMSQKESAVIRFLRRRVPMTETFDGVKVRTVVDGKKVFTPVLVVFVAIGTTDLVFALDSIPAIFGITQNAFIVFTANVFALMGLRQLYFLLGDLIDKLEYLRYGIAAVLGFIAVKLVLHALHENEVPFINGGHPVDWAPEIGTWVSLAVIVTAMAVATIASLVALRVRARSHSHEDN
jgi:tellurite resistance protein TerC